MARSSRDTEYEEVEFALGLTYDAREKYLRWKIAATHVNYSEIARYRNAIIIPST